MRSRYRIRDYSFSESLENESCLRKYFRVIANKALISYYGKKEGYIDYRSRRENISNVNLTFDELRWVWLEREEKFEKKVSKSITNRIRDFEELEASSVMLVDSPYDLERNTCIIYISKDRKEFNIFFPKDENIDEFFPRNRRYNLPADELYKLESDDLGQYVRLKTMRSCASCNESKNELYFPEMFCHNCKKKEAIAKGLS